MNTPSSGTFDDNGLTIPDFPSAMMKSPPTSTMFKQVTPAHGVTESRPVEVLVVEPDRKTFERIQSLLHKGAGRVYSIDWAEGEAQAIAAIEQKEYDLGLFSYALDKATGLDLLRDLVSRDCEMPMILLTADESEEIDYEAATAGAADCLSTGLLNTAKLERSIRYALKQASMTAV